MTPKQIREQFDSEISKAESEMQALKARLATLKEMRAKFAGTKRNGDQANGPDGGPMGPGQAIRRLVTEQPGVMPEQIIEMVSAMPLKTKSNNKGRLVRNTMTNMIRDQILEKDEKGGLVMKEG